MTWHYLDENSEPCTFSPGPAVEYLPTCSSGMYPSALLRLTPMPEACSSPASAMVASDASRFGMMLRRLTDDLGSGALMWLAADSRVRTFRRPEKGRELGANVLDCGRTWPASSVKFDPDTCWWKTHRCLFPEDLTLSWLTLPSWGSMHNGELSEHTTSALLTSGTGYGFLHIPTPTVSDTSAGPSRMRGDYKRYKGMDLATFAATWPTPVSTDGTHGGRVTPRKSREGGNLIEAVSNRTWPTPTAQNASNCGGPSQMKRKTPPLDAAVKMWPTPRSCTAMAATITKEAVEKAKDRFPNLETVMAIREPNAAGGTLNPNWVEWLMGWPIGHTDSSASAMGRFRQWRRLHGRCSEGQ